MPTKPFYAHSLENEAPGKWETMAEHEGLVASYCRRFLKRIHPGLELRGDLLGRWHDLVQMKTKEKK